jgi:hypothetical protein
MQTPVEAGEKLWSLSGTFLMPVVFQGRQVRGEGEMFSQKSSGEVKWRRGQLH